jgi:hypothetical protein
MTNHLDVGGGPSRDRIAAKKRVVHYWQVFLLLLGLAASPAWSAIAVDAIAFGDSAPSTSVTSQPVSASAGRLLLAFVASDANGPTIVNGVTGGNLTWVLVRRTNAQLGTAEIWRAFATSGISNMQVTAALSKRVAASITVVVYSGTDTSGTNGSGAIGAINGASAGSGAPSASLTTTRDGSWVYGVGNDYDNAIPRTVGPNQTKVHEYLPAVNDTYWVQSQNAPTPTAGTSVTINDTAPTTDRWNLSIVEVLPPAGPTYTVFGSITPAASGVGTVVTLQNASVNRTATADSNGNFSFASVANGSYTLTPAKSGFTFSPTFQSATVNGSNVTVQAFTATAATQNLSISGTVLPANIGVGTTLTLSGSASATTTANSSGGYSFTGLQNGTYTVTPSKTNTTFTPTSTQVTLSGSSNSTVNFTAQTVSGQILYPDLSVIMPPGAIAVTGTGTSRVFNYTHDTFNGGPGPLVIQPVYNQATGLYQGTQYVYSLNNGTWTLAKQIPIAGTFYFHAEHGHFHYPFASFGIYQSNANGSIGALVAPSEKNGFCIADSFIYDPSLPNAGALGNLGSCSDPTSLRGLDIGAVDEYDMTDPGQSIAIGNLADGTYWLRAQVDPDNYLTENSKSNNETDIQFSLKGSTVKVLQTVVPTLNPPPAITLLTPANAASVTGTVNLTASTVTSTGVQYILDGSPLGPLVQGAPYTLAWDSTTVTNGNHLLAAQTKDATGVVGTSNVASITVVNAATPPTVTLTSPVTGDTVSGSIALAATVASQNPITSVQFYVDNNAVGSPITTPPYIYYWNSLTVAGGTHTVSVSALDSLGQIGNSASATITVDNSHPPLVIGQDVVRSVDGHDTMSTAAFTTPSSGDFVVAFVAYDGPPSAPQTASVSGGGLTWALLKRSNTQSGTSEIWAAQAAGVLTNVAITARPGVTGFDGSLTVIAFSNASGAGVVGQASAPTGPPDIYVPGVGTGNWVFAVGNDWDRAVARTPVAGQVIVHQYIDSNTGDTFWVQSTTAPNIATQLVDIHDDAPTGDQWNYCAVEIVAKRQ